MAWFLASSIGGNNPIKYSFSDAQDEFRNLLRNFTLDKLLSRINEESVFIFHNSNKDIGYGVVKRNIDLIDMKNRLKITPHVIISGWGLIDLSYSAILYTNDFRGKKIETNDELDLLVFACEKMKEVRETALISSMPENSLDVLLLFFGFAGEQIKIEMLGKVLSNAARELYILFESAKHVEGMSNISDIVRTETGVDWKIVITTLFLTWAGSTKTSTINEIENSVLWDDAFKKEDFEKVINRYTSGYQEIRDSTLGRQSLYQKPFVISQRNEILSVNCYLNMFLYEHCIMWIVRDYYNNRNDRRFTAEFGYCYEYYFEEILNSYLDAERFVKLETGTGQRADWKIVIGDFKILVEQKSSILGLQARQQESDLDTIKRYINRNINKAINQLYKTENDFDDGKYIKIIVIYDDYLLPDIQDCIFMTDFPELNDNLCWIATISEIEDLLYLSKNNTDLFNDILVTKIDLEARKSKAGRSFSKIFSDKGLRENLHIKQDRFTRYEILAKEIARQHLQ